jgi:putative ABC transport system permease protein
MRLRDQLLLAQSSLSGHPLRTFLTTLGMIVGVAAVVAMVSIGLGARHQIENEIARLGTNLLTVQPVSQTTDGLKGSQPGKHQLSEGDARALVNEIFQVQYAVPVVNGGVRIVHGNNNWSTSVAGTYPEYVPARDWMLSRGRNFTPAEVTAMAKVALVGRTVERKLSPLQPLLGSMIRVQNVPFRVVGVLAEKGYSVVGRDQDNVIIVPITTARTRLLGGYLQRDRDSVNYILVKARGADDMAAIEQSANRILRHRHGISGDSKNDFHIRDPMAALSAKRSASETLTLLLGCIAAVSLVVGGISIMNIMLVSVVERTREIGIRIAVGADRRDIRNQFLAESAVVAIAGGTLGILLGVGAAYLIESTTGWKIQIEAWVVAGALVFSTAVGMLSGLYPAIKASKLDPIEAIRHE